MMEMHAIVVGQVQGVGFRGAVRRLASVQDIHGYIRNQEDGSVELVLQGKKEEIEALLKRLKSIFNIERIEEDWRKAEKNLSSFEVL